MHVVSLVTECGISLLLDNEHYVIPKDHINYDKIRVALERKEYDSLRGLVDVSGTVRDWVSRYPDLSIVSGQIAVNGEPFENSVSQKVFSMIEAGNEAGPLVNFLRKVRMNPSSTARKELLLFCVANGFMIHEDGDILAYKSVREDYTDIHSGTFVNTVGTVNVMNRGQVDDDRTITCSHGLHFAAFDYASTWAGSSGRHLMVMKIHPKDVVSIPNDYNDQKGRCCRYEVVAEVKNWKPLPKKEVYTDEDYDGLEEDIDDHEDTCCTCGAQIDAVHRHAAVDVLGYNYCPVCGNKYQD